MAGVKILGFTIIKSEAEREIEDIFKQHEEHLLVQKQKMTDEITEWTAALTQSICKSMNQQRYYLEQEYAEQVRQLKETRDEFIGDLRAREQRKETEEINQLVELYKTLQYELAALQETTQTIPFIQVPYRKKFTTKSRDGFTIVKTRNAAFDNGSLEDDYELENSMNALSTFSSDLSFSNTAQTNAQASQQNSSNGSRDDDDDDTLLDLNEENSEKKCPVCFMVFPLTMKGPDRYQHTQEHFTDN